MTLFRVTAISASLLLAALSVSTSLNAASRLNDRTTVPNGHHMAMLVHSAIAALDQANRSGNYAVLRTLAAPAFQRANDERRLAAIFADLRARRVNLAPTILYDPMLKRPAWIDEEGRLRLAGFFATAPLRIHFDLQFEHVAGQWRLFGIAIQPREAPASQTG